VKLTTHHHLVPRSKNAWGHTSTPPIRLYGVVPGREADHSPPSSAEVKECVGPYIYSPNTSLWRGAQLQKAQGQLYFLHSHSLGINVLYKSLIYTLLFFCYVSLIGPLVLFRFSLTYETMNSFRHFCRTPWMGDQPIAMPLPTQNNTTLRNVDIHSYVRQDLNPRSQCSSGSRRTRSRGPALNTGLTLIFTSDIRNIYFPGIINTDTNSYHEQTKMRRLLFLRTQ
jgi:hypothetical protein